MSADPTPVAAWVVFPKERGRPPIAIGVVTLFRPLPDAPRHYTVLTQVSLGAEPMKRDLYCAEYSSDAKAIEVTAWDFSNNVFYNFHLIELIRGDLPVEKFIRRIEELSAGVLTYRRTPTQSAQAGSA